MFEGKKWGNMNTLSKLEQHSSSKIKRITTLVLVVGLVALLTGLVGCSCSSEEPKKEESKSAETVSAPNVVGMTKDDAQRVIKDNGFTFGKTSEENSETVPSGNVISQDPKEKSEVKAGATINLVISKGSAKAPEQVTVPNLTGMTQTQAEKALLDLKLVPMPGDPVVSNDVAAGTVLQQSNAAGTSVNVGTTITFVVALGADIVAVPNVVNQGSDAASKALKDAALGVDIVEEYDASIPAGSVISQNPSANIKVVKGTTVTIHVSKGAVPVGNVAVPDMSTMSLAQALQVMSSAGLILAPSGGDLNGTVVSQSPAAGTNVAPGSTVSVTIESPKTIMTSNTGPAADPAADSSAG